MRHGSLLVVVCCGARRTRGWLRAWRGASRSSHFRRGPRGSPFTATSVAARGAEMPTCPVWTSRGPLRQGLGNICRGRRVASGRRRGRLAVASRHRRRSRFASPLLASAVGWAAVDRRGPIASKLGLVEQRRLWWLAAILPPLWATSIGFGAARARRRPRQRGRRADAEKPDDATRAIAGVTQPVAEVVRTVQHQPPVAESDEPPEPARGAGEKPTSILRTRHHGRVPTAFYARMTG